MLVGFMGAGKTTVGRILASKLGVQFFDTDAMVVSRARMSIPEIFATRGEPGFREREREAAYDALSEADGVVSLGGGALGDPGIVGQLQRFDVVHLDVGYGEAMKRVGGDAGRPMLQRNPRTLYGERRELYEHVAGLSILTDGRDPEDIAIELARHFGAESEDVDRVLVGLGDRSYEIVVGDGLVGRVGELLPETPNAEKAFVVTTKELEPYLGQLPDTLSGAGLQVSVLHLPDGEAGKSLDEVQRLYDELADHEAHRHDLLVTFGGGAVSDTAGFVASTFARGMRLVHIPTTLLGQVDAAIGGKTGVNLSAGKNLVGTIHQPIFVACDVALLATCPPEELRAGVAEVVKYGLIADPTLLDVVRARVNEILGADRAVLSQVVARSAGIKAEIVSVDERESGPRAFLNYGHTVGHAVEKINSFTGIRHGEAVSIGMMAAAYMANELGRIDQDVVDLHRDVLEAAGLPVSADLDLDELESAWKLDKKYANGVRFVLLSGLARPEAGVEVPTSTLIRAVQRLRS